MAAYGWKFRVSTGPLGVNLVAPYNSDRVAFIYSYVFNTAGGTLKLGRNGENGTFFTSNTCNTHNLNLNRVPFGLGGEIYQDVTAVAGYNLSSFDISGDSDCWPPCDGEGCCLNYRWAMIDFPVTAPSRMMFPANPTRMFLYLSTVRITPGTEAQWGPSDLIGFHPTTGLEWFGDGEFSMRYKNVGPIIREPVFVRGDKITPGFHVGIETYY